MLVGMQGHSDPDRELSDAAALVTGLRWKVAAGLALDDAVATQQALRS